MTTRTSQNRSGNSSVITEEQLRRMKVRAGLISQPNQDNNQEALLAQKSRDKTANWTDNVKDLKKRKQEQRFKKFQKEEIQRRRIDKMEQEYQDALKSNALEEAQQKIFQQQEPIKTLNSKLIISDALQEREVQVYMNQHLKDLNKKREQMFHDQLLETVKKQELEEAAKKEVEKEKLDQFRKNIKKQHKDLRKTLIGKMKQEMEEGELLKYQAQMAIEEEKDKQRQRREKEINLKVQSNQINSKNKQLRQKQLEKERLEEQKIEQYKKKQDKIQQMRKNTEKELINDKIKQREAMYEKEVARLKAMEDKTNQTYNRQFQQTRIKQENVQKKKRDERERLKLLVDQSIQTQKQKKKFEKQKQEEDQKNFDELWSTKIQSLNMQDNNQKTNIRDQNKRNQEFLKQQVMQKQRQREEDCRRQMDEAEQRQRVRQNEDSHFNSYAEQCVKTWAENGKNLYPIIKHLQGTRGL